MKDNKEKEGEKNEENEEIKKKEEINNNENEIKEEKDEGNESNHRKLEEEEKEKEKEKLNHEKIKSEIYDAYIIEKETKKEKGEELKIFPKEKGQKKEEKEKEEEEEKAFSYKGSESLIDNILIEEFDQISKNENEFISKRPSSILPKRSASRKPAQPRKAEKVTKLNIKDKSKTNNDNKKYKTLNDLEKAPYKKIKINSPRSVKIIKENGYTQEELYYMPLDRFLLSHKETINMNKSEQKTRYNFYEQLRLEKIKKLCKLREKLIIKEKKEEEQEEEEKNNKIKLEKENINNNSRYKTIYVTSNSYEKIKSNKNDDNDLIKKIIIENEERITDNKLERIKNINEIELANIVEYELDKNLNKIELDKQAEKYKKELGKLSKGESNKKKEKKIVFKLKNSGNNKPIINKYTTFNENIVSFHVAKKIKEYDLYQQKLEQRLKKMEIINKKKNEKIQEKKKLEIERTKINLRKSNDIFNRKQNELIKKMQMKDLITNAIKKIINEKNSDKKEINMQKYLSKRDYIDKLKRIEDYEREQKLNDLIGKGNERSKIRDIKNRIYSSRIYKINDIKNEQRNNICKIQKILRNGEGEDEENLDILMEEFPDNPKIAQIVKKYQIKKNNIENDNKVRLRLYSSYNINLFTSGNNKPNGNNYISQSTDKRRIFIYAHDKNGMNYINKSKNELIKKEERRINNTNPNRNITNEKDIDLKEKYPDLEEDEIDDFDDNEEIEYEHEIAEKVRQFKAKIYKNFLKK